MALTTMVLTKKLSYRRTTAPAASERNNRMNSDSQLQSGAAVSSSALVRRFVDTILDNLPMECWLMRSPYPNKHITIDEYLSKTECIGHYWNHNRATVRLFQLANAANERPDGFHYVLTIHPPHRYKEMSRVHSPNDKMTDRHVSAGHERNNEQQKSQ